MRRLFLPGKLADTVTLTGSDAHHLGYTLRARVGERCVVVDAERAVASMEIVGFTADTVTLRLVERLAALTFVASLAVGCSVFAVDGLGKNARARCLAHATRTAEQVGMRQLTTGNGILQGLHQSLLPYYGLEGGWTIFSS